MNPYLQLFFAALLPVVLVVGFFFLDKFDKFKGLKPLWKQVIYGLAFGAIAIIGTEWVIPVELVRLECRNAAVLVAGLLYGGPAGAIAGCLAGAECLLNALWSGNTLGTLSGAIILFISGFYAWIIRRYILENRPPSGFFAFCMGVVVEVLHMTLVFITNNSNPTIAIELVQLMTTPMVIANSVSILLSTLTLYLLYRERLIPKKGNIGISMIIQSWMLVAVAIAYAVTTSFVYQYQTSLATYEAEELLQLAVEDTQADIQDRSDSNILNIAYEVKDEIGKESLKTLASEYNLAEINLVGSDGIIYESNIASYVGFSMASGEQSAEFLCLLDGTESYVQPYMMNTYSGIYRKYAGVVYKDGFLQVGYDAANFQKDIDEQVKDITKNRRVGTDGFIVIVDDKFELVSAPEWLIENKESIPLIQADQSKMFTITMLDELYYGEYVIDESYYIISFLPESEAMETRNLAIYVNSFMEVLVFAILFGMIYALIHLVVIKKLDKVNASLSKISNGDLNETIDVRNAKEFVLLSNDINTTVNTLKRYIDDASKRIDAELELARQIQSSVLPKVESVIEAEQTFDIAATMNPAKEVGGDFYDFYFDNIDSLNLLIADVSGKGIPAAMFMMRAKAELKSLTEAHLPLEEVFTKGNAALCEGNDAGMFVTAFQIHVDLDSGNCQYTNAGHNPPLVYHQATGRFEYLKSKAGFILAGMDGFQYKKQELKLEKGDIVFLYTDGVTEATNPDHELYGETRLLNLLNQTQIGSMKELTETIRQDIDKFASGAPQADDITMLAFHYLGKKPVPMMEFESIKLEDIETITSFLDDELEKISAPTKVRIQLDVALDEIVSNIIHHGYREKGGYFQMEFDYREERGTLYLKFTDQGIPYNPLTNADPDVDAPLEERKAGGLGIYMVKKSMDDMKYKYEDGKNILTLTKVIKEVK